MHCFSSRVTSWLTWTLRVGGFVLRRRIGASVIRPSHLGWPTQHQRRSQEAVAVLGSQTIPWDRHRQIERKFCTIVGGVMKHFLANGKSPGVGHVMRLPALAATLKAIAAGGAKAFYEGPIAADIAATVQAAGGLLAAEDLARHAGDVVELIATNYRGLDVVEL